MTEPQKPEIHPCQYCGNESEQLAPCDECALMLCPDCLHVHDCLEDD